MGHSHTDKGHVHQHHKDAYGGAGNATEEGGDYSILHELVAEDR
jgi:hypothetical protein